MPCAEIADAIVQTARTTLERAIRLIEGNPAWRARVVYGARRQPLAFICAIRLAPHQHCSPMLLHAGDTDSMFVLLPGRSVDDAFKVGEEIAAEVTARNPRPMTLKLEKVYHPCVLVAKKRYAGERQMRVDGVVASTRTLGCQRSVLAATGRLQASCTRARPRRSRHSTAKALKWSAATRAGLCRRRWRRPCACSSRRWTCRQ